MPRAGEVERSMRTDDGSTDQVVQLQRKMKAMEDEMTLLRDTVAALNTRLKVLEQQKEEAPPRQQQRDGDGDVGDGWRSCINNCGLAFRIDPCHPTHTHCCSRCRNGTGGHSRRCGLTSRPCESR